jgi:uncharacterized protein YciU (UPF0263 family)
MSSPVTKNLTGNKRNVLLLKLQFRKRRAAELVSCNETHTLKAKRIKVC